MSWRWAYIVVVIVIVSWLRYIGYKRSKRVEEKLDIILEALGVDPTSIKGSTSLNKAGVGSNGAPLRSVSGAIETGSRPAESVKE